MLGGGGFANCGKGLSVSRKLFGVAQAWGISSPGAVWEGDSVVEITTTFSVGLPTWASATWSRARRLKSSVARNGRVNGKCILQSL